MNPIATQQAALDNALVPSEKRLKIERCNARIAFSKPQREETYQVTLEALKLSSCYLAFQITAEVPEIYTHQFWTTIKKIRNSDACNFKLEKKKFRVDTEDFYEILQICSRILNQEFIAPPLERELVTFIHELGYSGKCNMLSAIHTDQMHQPWRTFATIINRCISGKTTRLDRLRESQAQILWGMYNKKNVDYVALLWEDFMYQADNKEISSARKEHMPYPRFTKVIINRFIFKDKTISMRNMINLHTIRNDSLLSTLKFISKTQDYQQYRALIPDDMINQDIKDSQAYNTYYDFATGKVPPRKARKYKKVALPLRKFSPVKEAEPVKKAKRVKRVGKKSTIAPTAGVAIRDTPFVFVSKNKAPTKADKSKGIEILSNVALSEATQLKEATKRSNKDFHISQASGLDDNNEFNDDDDDDDNINDDDSKNEDDDGNDAHDSQRTNSEDDDKNPSFTLKDYDEEEHDEEYESDDDNENVFEEEDDDLYKDVDVRSLGVEQEKERKGDEEMTDANQNVSQENKVLILDNVSPVVDEVASIMNVKNRKEESSTRAPSLFIVPETAIPETSTAHATTVPPTISMITPLPQLMKPSHASITVPTTTSIPALPDFSSLFGFDQRVSTLETELSQLKQADLSAQLLESVKSQLLTMVDDLLSTRIGYATKTTLQSYTKEFEKKAQEEKNTINESLKNVVLAKSSSQPKSTYEAATSLIEFKLKKILLDKIEKSKLYQAAPEHRELYDGLVKSYNLDKDLFSSYGNLYSLKRDREDKNKDEDPSDGSDRGLKKRKTSKDSVQAYEPVFEIADTKMPQDQGGNTKDQPNVEATPTDDWFKKPERPPTPDPDWNATKFLMSTPIDFSAYVMHNLTQEILVWPAINLLKGTCKSFMELEYHFEECYKAVTDQLDWNNPEGHEYPFDLSKPLPLIEAQGRQVVLVDYFFNNDLEYLKGGSSSRKYTTSTIKTKAAKYENIEGIKDMVSTLWSPVKKRIIAVTHVKVMKWYGYGYLEEIIVRREDQMLHKFKEGDFPRLNRRDSEDLMLLLVQKKLFNLEKDVIFDLNVALRIFTRRIVIIKRVEDLQLGVKSYHKKLNITKHETFRPDISKMTPYTAYKNPQGIIYQDKLQRNRLMRSDELYKFYDGTLTSVQRVLHDLASNLSMDYLPKRRCSNLDRKRSHIMIKAIDQQLFERRLMRNLEKFIGGREYGNDFRLLEWAI
ncbi:hypothetical protein Tco_0014617 [Tanacetum coccineum]